MLFHLLDMKNLVLWSLLPVAMAADQSIDIETMFGVTAAGINRAVDQAR